MKKDLTQYTPNEFEKDSNISRGDIDLLVGGPPCQGFSLAGRRDKNDPRNSLFIQFVGYLNYFKPKMFIMENVRGILSMKANGGELCSEIILEYLREDYNCLPFSLYARDFEVPQIRNRVLFIGIRKDLNKEPICPTKINPDNHIPVSDVLLSIKQFQFFFTFFTQISVTRNRRNNCGKKKIKYILNTFPCFRASFKIFNPIV